ncbi:hypothetical protein HYU16_04630 [Candidatus Woesearchaeota archaeon]|nr:hypothetical protein [Candidatus Woesearchaeota archaeon]
MAQNLQRKILLPRTLEERLKTFAGLEQETVGALFYVPLPVRHLVRLRVDGLFMLGRGHRYEVRPEDARWRIMERFLKDNPPYGYIDWHTHPSGNIDYLAGNDLAYFKREIAEDPSFLGMIVTRQKIVTVAYGQGTRDTSVVVVPNPADFAQRRAYISSKIVEAARSLGHENLPHLQATRMHRT